MAYAALCRDQHADALSIRQSELDAHLNYVARIADRVLVAGPLNTEGSTDFNASLFIYAVETEQEARELLENDPYYRAGIYGDVTLAPFTPARGTWL